MVFSATVSLMLAPFLLPKMHDRYFFAADLCSIALAFIIPRLWFVPVGLQISSTLAYVPILCEFYDDLHQGQLTFCEFAYVALPVAVCVNTALVCYRVSVYFAGRSATLGFREASGIPAWTGSEDIHSLSRSADSATNRRDAADLEVPSERPALSKNARRTHDFCLSKAETGRAPLTPV